MSNTFGNLFKITTWGESHGKAIGVVIDGCPAGLGISEEEINHELAKRAPGKLSYTSPRNEIDQVQIYSGIFEGQTTGAPISLIIPNRDADSSKYESIKQLLRPGHANFSYLEKYGVFDYKGGGRASARETACRVAAGAVAKKLLQHFEITVSAHIKEVAGITSFEEIVKAIEAASAAGDSLGGIIEFQVDNLPSGFGEPIYNKMEAMLANAMLSIPASKGFEIGSGFACARMRGSEHNDSFVMDKGCIKTSSNHAGGVLGGITNGMPLVGRVAFKPTSSIKKPQETLTTEGEHALFKLPEGSRHDPCVVIRAVPVVEAMVALVIADALLLNRSAQI